jgi:hypothetical protein
VLVLTVHIKRGEMAWETFTVASEEEAINKIRQRYPKASNRSFGAARDRSFPVGQVMYIYEAQESTEHSSRLVARISEN